MTGEEVLADITRLVDEIASTEYEEAPSYVIFPTQQLRDMFGVRCMPVRKRPKRLAKKVAKRGVWDTTMGTARAERRRKRWAR